MSHRGKALQPDRECDYCNTRLVDLRHPNAKYCNTICRGRDRWSREHISNGIICLECGKTFVRVGSHVVQVHGYENVSEYKKEHGLMGKETHTEEHAALMRSKVTDKAICNLDKGENTRFHIGGNHAENLRKFWKNRRANKNKVNKEQK